MFFEGRDVLLAACLQVRVFVRARVVVLIVIAGIARARCVAAGTVRGDNHSAHSVDGGRALRTANG